MFIICTRPFIITYMLSQIYNLIIYKTYILTLIYILYYISLRAQYVIIWYNYSNKKRRYKETIKKLSKATSFSILILEQWNIKERQEIDRWIRVYFDRRIRWRKFYLLTPPLLLSYCNTKISCLIRKYNWQKKKRKGDCETKWRIDERNQANLDRARKLEKKTGRKRVPLSGNNAGKTDVERYWRRESLAMRSFM